MMLKPQWYETKKRGRFLELRLYIAGMRLKNLAQRIPSCFGLIHLVGRCRCRCSIKGFCKKVSVQFRGVE